MYEIAFNDAYDALSKLKLGGERGKIVLFIDDLDRCLPDVAVQLLESIKLVLSQAGFIFVLGMSRPVIDGYLNKRYQQDFGLTDFIGRNYLDKIVQLAFYIPSHRERIEGFAETVLDVLNEDDRIQLIDILPIIGVACGYNPRIAIRFVNNLLIDTSIRRNIPIGYFAITRSLQQYWFEAFLILTQHDSYKLCEKTYQWLEKGVPTFDDKSTIEAQLAISLKANPDLVQLLSTTYGIAWLYNHDQRVAAIQFLKNQTTIPAIETIVIDHWNSLRPLIPLSTKDQAAILEEFELFPAGDKTFTKLEELIATFHARKHHRLSRRKKDEQ